MNELINSIKEQINNCRKLLSVFQNERQLYKERSQIGVKEVMEIMERKKQILTAFENQRALLRKSENENSKLQPEVMEKKKSLIRELAGTLEQLLVIDRENEMLLRDIMSSKSQPLSGNTSSAPRQRPALQRQLPLVPGIGGIAVPQAPAKKAQSFSEQILNTVPVQTGPKSAPVQTVAAQNEKNTDEVNDIFKYKPKSCLREYSSPTQLLKFASKYA
ncbi:MAG: hypothetical protein A2017_09730 [Lentisphaerae bacterium GWF2_44_16]|nr:MAG: hypothetical protein A2017_09730 [Lentisphaerae bacterium GWF2_44_16]